MALGRLRNTGLTETPQRAQIPTLATFQTGQFPFPTYFLSAHTYIKHVCKELSFSTQLRCLEATIKEACLISMVLNGISKIQNAKTDHLHSHEQKLYQTQKNAHHPRV